MNERLIISLGALAAAGYYLYSKGYITTETTTVTTSGFVPPSFSSSVARWQGAAVGAATLYPIPGLDRERQTALLLSVIAQESSGNPDALGAAGEQGLMQLTPGAVQDVGGVWPPPTAADNLLYGAKYLQLQISRMGGSVYDGLRAYNAGAGNAKSSRTISDAYARSVLNRANLSNLIDA